MDKNEELINYLHRPSQNLGAGVFMIILGALGLLYSCTLWSGIANYPYTTIRIPIFVFLIPIGAIILLIIGISIILSVPSKCCLKAKDAHFFQTQEGMNVVSDFVKTSRFFEDEVRVGKNYFYKKQETYHSFEDIVFFSLEKKIYSIDLMYKEESATYPSVLISFTSENFEKNKKDVIRFFTKMRVEHPEIFQTIL